MPIIKFDAIPATTLEDIPPTSPSHTGVTSAILRSPVGSSERDPNFQMAHNTESLSVSHIEFSGRHELIRCDEEDRVMYVVDGHATAQVGNSAAQTIERGDFILIPKGTPYVFEGELTYLGISSPAYREGSDIFLAETE